jgi:hypothetical protein
VPTRHGSYPFTASDPKVTVERLPAYAPPVLLIGYNRARTLTRNAVPLRKLFDALACFISSDQRSISVGRRDLASHSVPNFILSEPRGSASTDLRLKTSGIY